MTAKNNTDIANDIRDFKAGGGRLGGRSVSGLTDLLTTLVDSNPSRKNVILPVVPGVSDQTVANSNGVFIVPAELNGYNLVDVEAVCAVAGVTGTATIQLRNATSAADILSTEITIDTGELSSATAATPAVIDTAEDDVATDDIIAVDIDTIHTGTAAKGLTVVLTFELPDA